MLGVLRTHPIAVIGDETYENFHYIKPGKLLGDNPKEVEFSSWEKGLKRAKSKKLLLEHFNSLLRSIRDVNQLLVSEKDTDTLIEKVCDTLAETRGYNNVWIALFDESNQLLTAAEWGLGEDFQPMLERLQNGDIPAKTRETIQNEGPVVTDDPFVECKDCPLAESYEGKTSITVRLEHAGRVYGILVTSVPTEYADTREEKNLIKEVANDIALGLHDKEVEEELRKSKERYQKYFEKTGDAIFILKMGGKNHGDILDVNAAATEQTNYSRDELLGMNMLEALTLETPSDFDLEEANSKLSQGETVRFTEKKKKKDGTEYWTEVVVTPLEHEGEQANLSINRDITERRKAKQKLKRSEERYRTVFENTGTAMIIIEEDTTISLVNEQAEKLSGYSKEEIEGRMSWTELVTRDEDLEKMKEHHRKRREDPAKAPNQYEFKLVDREGKEKDVLITIDVTPGTKKSISSLIDITERKRMEEQIQEDKIELRQSFIQLAETTSRVLGIRDPYTQKHEQRVAELAERSGRGWT